VLIPYGNFHISRILKRRKDRNHWRILWDGDREGYNSDLCGARSAIHPRRTAKSIHDAILGNRWVGEKAQSLDWP
jgi:hypothetical protein